MNNIDEVIKQNIDDQINCLKMIREKNTEKIKNVFDVLKKCKEKQNTIYILGNGGSASTASHFASDLLKTGILENENRFRVISLTDNTPVILAWGNDESFDNIFVQQLKNFVKEEDVVIGISGSGNSKNVLNAIDFANKTNAMTISFTGNDGGELAKISKLNLNIPSNDMLTIESMHLVICHLLLTIIRNTGNPMFKY
tara:strand:+ start:707 stop:1300 length:594 start_codon:yes stop_codon:yes gene_type:complete